MQPQWSRNILSTIKFLCYIFGLMTIGSLLIPYKILTPQSTLFLDRNGILLEETRKPVRSQPYSSLHDLPKQIPQILIKNEDKRFLSHWGIDLFAIGRASRHNILAGEIVEGGSTIDQQLIKLNRGAFFGRSVFDKIIEIRNAFRLNLRNTKDEIMLGYVNNLTFGRGVIGLQSACMIFYNTPCKSLSTSQLLILIAKAKFPGKKNLVPYALHLATLIADSSVNSGTIQLAQEQLGFYAPRLMQEALDILPPTTQSHIQTTFDLKLYQTINTILEKFQPYLMSKDAQDACIVVFENGKLRTMNLLRQLGNEGSYVNGCLAPRQVGSAIKPFLYLLAFEKYGMTGGTIIDDSPVSYQMANGGAYQPKNFDLAYHGKVTVAQALGSSLNIPAVKTLDIVGIDTFYQFLKQIGISVGTQEERTDNPQQFGLSLALGSKEISPYDFTKMRTVFSTSPAFSSPEPSPLRFDHNTIRQITTILSSNSNRLLSFPQDNRFDIPNGYAKSGTSRGFVDGRTCGGRGARTVCVRVGNYSGRPTKDSGYSTAGALRHEVIMALE